LLDAKLGKRSIRPALPAAGGVPDGLSMAYYKEAAHQAILTDR